MSDQIIIRHQSIEGTPKSDADADPNSVPRAENMTDVEAPPCIPVSCQHPLLLALVVGKV
jgi:hypothetical protein